MNLQISIAKVVCQLVPVTAMTTNGLELPIGLLDLVVMILEQHRTKVGHDYELMKIK